MVIEPPFCRPPVTPLSVPMTEPRPVPDPVLEPLLLLLPSPLEPVLAGLLACIGPLAWIMLLPVVDEDEDADEVPQDAPMTLAAAATSPDTGRARPQRTCWPS